MKVSLICPAIRTHLWKGFYDSARLACKENEFEIIFVSPFDLPESLQGVDNVKLIKDYGSPSRCTQIAVLSSVGEFIYNCVDDGVFYENCIDDAVKQFESGGYRDIDIINMRYRESKNSDRDEFDSSYWEAHKVGLALPGVLPNWSISLHFFMKRGYYMWLGGVDTCFEYVNHGAHDLMFRAQGNGSIIYPSNTEGLNCSHQPERTGDHGPIHDAQVNHDEAVFVNLYKNPRITYERRCLDYDGWKKCSPVWNRRFGKNKPKTYEDLEYD